jgi:hypothetical protein
VSVEDDVERRVRLPADALRCTVQCAEIVLLVSLGLLARATVSGVETNVVGASQLADRKLLTGVLGLLGDLAHVTLLLMPLALAVLLLVRRRPRRLAEAFGAGIAAVVVVTIVNAVLHLPAAAPLYDALTLSISQTGGPCSMATCGAGRLRHRSRAVGPTALARRLLGCSGLLPDGQPGQRERSSRNHHEHHDGVTLAGQDGEPSDEQLRQVWDAVLQLHRHRGYPPPPDR